MFSAIYSVDAQWYNRSCGVIDISNWTPDEFECMWRNASRHVVGGTITTGIGIRTIPFSGKILLVLK